MLNCSLDLCIHLTGYAMTLLLGLKKLIVGLFFIVTHLVCLLFSFNIILHLKKRSKQKINKLFSCENRVQVSIGNILDKMH